MRIEMVVALIFGVTVGLSAQSGNAERGSGKSAREAAAVDALKSLRAETRELDIVSEAWSPGENHPTRGRTNATQDRIEAEAIARHVKAAHVKTHDDALICQAGCVARGRLAVLRVSPPVPQADGAQRVHVQLITPPTPTGSYEVASTIVSVRLDRGIWRAEGAGEVELGHSIIGAAPKRP
ncbi:MAG: hypothetical protein WCL36_03115 [bacterium]|jgi:hypothetical protein